MIQMNWNQPTAHFQGRLLALDTSTAAMSIAILEQGKLLQEAHIHADRTHSLHLMPMIKQLMLDAGMKLTDLSGIAIGVGPGSYTGVRIGVTAAKTLAWTLKLPIIGVSSLEAMALGVALSDLQAAQDQPQWIVPLMDARRAQAYTGLYRLQGNEWQCLASDGIRLISNWMEQLTQLLGTGQQGEAGELEQAAMQVQATLQAHAGSFKQPRISFVGEVSAMLEPLNAFELANPASSQLKEAEVGAFHIGLLGSLRLAAGVRSDVHQIIPNYTQLTEAEVNLLAKLVTDTN